MKIKTKALIATGITCLLLIVFTAGFRIVYPSLIGMGVIVIVLLSGLFIFFYRYIIRRIETLNKQLNQVNFHPSDTVQITLSGKDELTEIAAQINETLDNYHMTLHRMEQQAEEKLNELQKSHATIQQITTRINLLTPENKKGTDQQALPNRAIFNDALNKAISHAKRHNKICAVLIINIDAFKNIPDTLENNSGNQILNEMIKRLTGALRKEDLVAQLGSEEFIVLLNDIDKSKFASIVAEKILQTCTQPINDFYLTTSIGISIYPDDGASLEDMLNSADSALFMAKQDGGNKYRFHKPEMDMEAHEFIRLETDLKNAIDRNELILYYQPKLYIKKGSIAGVEALLRWAHPESGIINPVKFISIAEDTGLMMKIGEWALREACKTNKYWQDEGYEHFAVALNLSPRQFQHPDIAKTIKTILKESELNPKYLELEISESTVMDHIEVAKSRLEAIKAIGVQLSIDHFGAGYTSISHLKQFPVSTIKIDQNYIKGIPNNPDDSAITNAFIGLAHNLGLEVVAEGVETGEQVQYLTLHNCDMVQGYFLSHPLPADKIVLQFKKLMDRALF